MRLYEWITVVFYATFGVLGWIRALPARRRTLVTTVALAGIGGILELRSTLLRDWLPLGFIPLAYFQTGQFVLPLHERFQSKLESLDKRWIVSLRGPIMFVFELAYLFCYPLVPCGLIALYLSGMGLFAEEFWNVVLPPAYLCYATFPFIRTLPQRAIEDRVPWQPQRTGMRKVNLFVLRHVSTQANTFPSGHVAASLAVALELLKHAPPVGLAFLVVSVCIAAGAFFGRYHYGVDVLLGAALAIVSFFAFV